MLSMTASVFSQFALTPLDDSQGFVCIQRALGYCTSTAAGDIRSVSRWHTNCILPWKT